MNWLWKKNRRLFILTSVFRPEIDDRRKGGRKLSDSEEEDVEPDRPVRGGVAIAPPPMLQDASSLDVTPRPSVGPSGASVAAKIMAKYGFKVRILRKLFKSVNFF